MTARATSSIKALISLLILALFVWGVGKAAFFPSLRLLQDTQWDFSLFIPIWSQRLLSLLWVVPAGLGFLGWSRLFHDFLFPRIEREVANLLGFSLATAFFSLYIFGLAINEILYWPLTALFFVPALWNGWQEWKSISFSWKRLWGNSWAIGLCLPIFLWAFEYLSPPLVWDAILDHYRYAREVSRLHQILFHWTNHTGDMPKAAELVLAGFWNLGGESLSKLSSAVTAFLTVWLFVLFGREWKGRATIANWIFWTCPFFLALYSWGYVEGFLALFEVLALYCFWKALQEPKNRAWLPLTAFFLGTAFVTKYTAVLAIAAISLVFIYEKVVRKNPLKLNAFCFLAFALPLFPWLLKGWLAFGNPFYPLATSIFGAVVGYGPEMGKKLLADTGLPSGMGFREILQTLWDSFFTTSNAVNAVWTPLAAMALPWVWAVVKKRMGLFLLFFSIPYFMGWLLVSSNFRHASGGTIGLVLLATMAWGEAFKEKQIWPKMLFGTGLFLSLWLCLSAQMTATAPYASALGLEDPLLRLKRHYSYDTDTYAAYRGIEGHSEPKDKVMAFAVWQTYSLNRIAFVDFKWKRPIFLQWASQCRTAEQLARLVRKEGVRYFLYQKWEANDMAREEKDFNLVGMSVSEYVRFWRYYTELVGRYENTFTYGFKAEPMVVPRKLDQLPGLQERAVIPGKGSGYFRP